VDAEGNAISIAASGYQAIKGATMTINSDSFTLQIDQSLTSVTDAGQHEIDIILKDDGPMPKFDNKVAFMVGIEYILMDPLEK
jgi:hypothetical protein